MATSSSASSPHPSTLAATSPHASRHAPSSPSTSTSGSRVPLSELSLTPFIFAAHNAHNIACNEANHSTPSRKSHGPSPILKPTSLSKKRATAGRDPPTEVVDAEADVTITGESNAGSRRLCGRSVQPITPPHHSTTPKNVRPHHPHIYSFPTSPLVVGAASPTLAAKMRGFGSPLKESSRRDEHEGQVDITLGSRSTPTRSTGPSTSKEGTDSLPRKRHRIQSGEAALAIKEADRPIIGTPSPHKRALEKHGASTNREGSTSKPRKRSVMETDGASDPEGVLQLVSTSEEDRHEVNPFVARTSSGSFAVYEDATDAGAYEEDTQKRLGTDLNEDDFCIDQDIDEEEEKENVRLSPNVTPGMTATTHSPLVPRLSNRPSAAPLQRGGDKGKGKGKAVASSSSSSSSSSDLLLPDEPLFTGESSSESGSSFFGSSTSSSYAEDSSGGPGAGAGVDVGGGVYKSSLGRATRRAPPSHAEIPRPEEGAKVGERLSLRKTARRKGTGGRLSLLASADTGGSPPPSTTTT